MSGGEVEAREEDWNPELREVEGADVVVEGLGFDAAYLAAMSCWYLESSPVPELLLEFDLGS